MLNVLLAVCVCTVAFLLVIIYLLINKEEKPEYLGLVYGITYSILICLCILYPLTMEILGAIVLSLVAIPTFYILTSTFR